MPTPTDIQRPLHVRKRTPIPVGVDAVWHTLVGGLTHGRRAFAHVEATAGRVAVLREELARLDRSQLDERVERMREHRRRYPSDIRSAKEEGVTLLALIAGQELGLCPHPAQIMAATAMIDGYLTEVDTGEGKTLALALAAAFIAWSGLPCHVITANDYLAGRDADYMQGFYRRVGLTVGNVLAGAPEPDRRAAYQCDITYTTAKEVAADHLRDRLRLNGMEDSGSRLSLSNLASARQSVGDRLLQRGLYHALIDEAAHSLIDEAGAPLIISRTLEPGEFELACVAAWKVAATLLPGTDYQADPATRRVTVDVERMHAIADRIDLPKTALWAGLDRRVELLTLALEAREFYHRGVQYVVSAGRVVLVEQATGRPMPMRTWRQGLHQMIEAKENVAISGATETLARISFQNFFRKYESITGASGAVREVASEIWQTYGVPTMTIPRNLPCRRSFVGSKFFVSQSEKASAVMTDIRSRHIERRPVLVGTRSVEASEAIARCLMEEKLDGCIVNAKEIKDEASRIAQAGRFSRITIATNMAGWGTDIHLDSGVEAIGGLHVILSEPHESARVDRQFVDRAGRQGDPGSAAAFYSVDDELFCRFLPGYVRRAWTGLLLSARCHEWGQRVGSWLLAWAHYRAQGLARRRRQQVMNLETHLARSLGFTRGNARNRPARDGG